MTLSAPCMANMCIINNRFMNGSFVMDIFGSDLTGDPRTIVSLFDTYVPLQLSFQPSLTIANKTTSLRGFIRNHSGNRSDCNIIFNTSITMSTHIERCTVTSPLAGTTIDNILTLDDSDMICAPLSCVFILSCASPLFSLRPRLDMVGRSSLTALTAGSERFHFVGNIFLGPESRLSLNLFNLTGEIYGAGTIDLDWGDHRISGVITGYVL